MLKQLAVLIVLAIMPTTALVAAPFEDGAAAQARGNDVEAAKWYRLAADQGHADAQYSLGVLYGSGRGVTQDYAEAAKWFRLAADQNHAAAQYNLGVMHDTGRGAVQDDAEAVKWFRLAATGESADAQFNLGNMYANGRGVIKDDVEAVKWFRKAAELGHARAQNNLGVMYGNGRGVAQDYVSAHLWFNLAASRGYQSAGNARDITARRMTPGQIAEAQRLARAWKPSVESSKTVAFLYSVMTCPLLPPTLGINIEPSGVW